MSYSHTEVWTKAELEVLIELMQVGHWATISGVLRSSVWMMADYQGVKVPPGAFTFRQIQRMPRPS